MSASLLVELQTEELPPKALSALSEAFAAGLERGLRSRHFLAPDSRTTAYGAPRRLGVLITEVLGVAPDQEATEKLMPVAVALDPSGKATPALRKKLASKYGREHLAELLPDGWEGSDHIYVQGEGKDRSVYLRVSAPGQTLTAGLMSALEEAIDHLPIPKVMSYQLADGHSTVQFVRPVQHLVALHGSAVVPISALGLAAGRTTRGHRFHTSTPIDIANADEYAAQLEREGRVIASFAARRTRLIELVQAAAARLGAAPIMPAELVDEVTALTEWPVVYESGFEREFLEVPEECLILTMQQNQKYFALRGADGRLTNTFLLASHIEAADGGVAIRSGNARVVRARLADAKFFYDQDRKQTLESRIPGLAHVVYHNKLGSQLERVERVVNIAVAIGRRLGADETHVERAARLAKADLRTLMVGEFPELQGIMGEYYAHHDGEAADVALAIREHYQPRFAGDALPASRVSLAVALADKLETLAGLFGIGQVPTGDKDPYALRRHALGVLRMLIERDLPLSLPDLVDTAFAAFGSIHGQAQAEVREFLFDRLVGYLREAGYTPQEIDAVIALRPPRWGDIPRRLAAVRAFSQLPEAESLAAANKRIGNILKKATEPVPASYRAALLLEPAEQALAASLERVAPGAEALAARGEYEDLLKSLAPLKLPVDAFFDEVMVNVDDAALRANRLALLARLHAAMNRVADLARLSS